jgi:hypothetical protein
MNNNHPYIFVGYFDCIVIAILIFLNIYFWKKSLSTTAGCVIPGVLFGFLLPVISMIIEINRINALDAFELLYTYLRFPTYWIIGIIQIIVIVIKRKKSANWRERHARFNNQ